ncbi:MAG TPA: chromosomal replication initiator protein DnaA [Acidimicrobiales bacterium]|nr:chromosomal replication initiator protein DnaA [Acidimicrobiales bacterium]
MFQGKITVQQQTEDHSGPADEEWSRAAEFLRSQVADAVWRSTFEAVVPVSVDDSQLTIEVPSKLIRERIEGRFMAMVTEAIGPGRELHIMVTPAVAPVPDEPVTLPAQLTLDEVRPSRAQDRAPTTAASDGYSDAINPRYTFEAFVTGASNRFAHAAALAVAERPGRSYNPLFIHGGAGLGKTHLLQAIVHYIIDNYPGYRTRYVSTETFLNEFVEAIRNNSQTAFKRRYRDIDILLVDDIQFIEGKEGLQEEFFHTFNSLHGAGRQVVLSSDRPPRAIATLEDRLRSRFDWGLTTDIQPPDLETRLAILRKKTEAEDLPVPPDVLEFIASHITNNIRELEGALIRVGAYASLSGEALNIESATAVLSDIVTDGEPRPITIGRILEATSEMFDFTLEELTGRRRHRALVTARQISMYVSRELTELSYPAIARQFGGRDHTTVIHAVDKISKQMAERREIYEQVTALIHEIKSR